MSREANSRSSRKEKRIEGYTMIGSGIALIVADAFIPGTAIIGIPLALGGVGILTEK